LYEVFLIISLAIPCALFSIFFILLFKWPQKIVPINKKNGAIKIEDFVNPINKSITSILKNNLYENSSLQKSLTDIHLLLEKMNSALIRFDEKKVENNNIDNNDRSVKTKSLSKSPSSFSSDVFSTVDLPKTKIEDTMIFKDKKDVHKNAKDIDEIVNSTYENNSIVELKSLEVEILNALKRLEKTNSDKNTEN